MNKEDVFLNIINKTISDNSYLGNDCAYLKDLNLLISQDTLIEDVHFSVSYFTPFEIAQKALLVNISDILAGGGKPKYITVSLSGKLNEDFIKEFYSGLNEICVEYGIKIIGGDLTGGDKITVSITIIGFGLKQISSRSAAKSGDDVYIAGYHGSSAFGLELLKKGFRDNENEFIKAHKKPVLYGKISENVANTVNSPYVMMDTSDGLYDAMKRVCMESRVGFDISYDKILKKVDNKNLVLFGGEDFGLLICLDKKYANLAESLNLQKIGTVTNTNQIVIDGVVFNIDKSFNHFK